MKKQSKPVLFYFLLLFVPSSLLYFVFLYDHINLGSELSLLAVSLSFMLVLLSTTHFNERPGVVPNVLTRSFLLFPVFCAFGLVVVVFDNITTYAEGTVLYLTFPILFNLFYNMGLCFVYIFFTADRYKPDFARNRDVLPDITVLIATRNEPFEVARMTFDCALAMDYPEGRKQLMVIDNSETDFPDYKKWRDYVEKSDRKNGCRCTFLHRDGTDGFKPRNLDIAMQNIQTEFVMLLDVDSTLHRDTLLLAMPQFRGRPKLGFMQLQTSATNGRCGVFARIISILQTTQRYVLNIRGHGGFVLFYGHNGIWRMEAARKAGNWLEHFRGEPMITEDMALTIRGYLAGYYGKTLWVESGEWVPGAVDELESMWLRWTYGNSQVLWKYMPRIFFSTQLTFFEKMDMFQTAILYISCGLAPIFAVIGLLHPNTSFFGFCYMIITFFPPLFLMIGYAFKDKDRSYSFLRRIWHMYAAFFIANTYISWVMGKGMFNFLICRRQGWKPTGKSGDGDSGWMRMLLSHLGVIIFSTGGVIAFSSIVIFRAVHHWYNDNMMELVYMAPGVFFVLNLLFCVILYGRCGMPSELDIKKLTISEDDNRQ